MQRLNSVMLLLLLSAMSFGQKSIPPNLPAFDYKRLHWGFTVGLNSMDFAIKRNPTAQNYLHADVVGFQPSGFQVNIVSDLRLSDNWNMRFLPGIDLGSRKMVYFDPDNNFEVVYTSTIGSSFLDFPLLFKYRSKRVNNYRPYLIGGMSYRIDMSAKSEFDIEQDDRIMLKKGDFYLEMGFGIDTYLMFFKFSPEIKLAVGLRNMLLYDEDNPDLHVFPGAPEYVLSIEKLQSFLVMLNFHFE